MTFLLRFHKSTPNMPVASNAGFLADVVMCTGQKAVSGSVVRQYRPTVCLSSLQLPAWYALYRMFGPNAGSEGHCVTQSGPNSIQYVCGYFEMHVMLFNAEHGITIMYRSCSYRITVLDNSAPGRYLPISRKSIMLLMIFAGIYISSIANNTMHKSLRSL